MLSTTLQSIPSSLGSCRFSSNPITARRQSTRNDVPVEGPAEYHRRALSIPLLDDQVGQIALQFFPGEQAIAQGLSLIQALFQRNKAHRAKFPAVEFVRDYDEALPYGHSEETLRCKLEQWELL